ncbi:MAG: hypothetical protein Q8Q09_07345 [Deltaproteobacteria bacterium]|nr:hypothetical protein [Deltaproteobacteria bacterium]
MREKLSAGAQAVKEEAAHFSQAARDKIQDKSEGGKQAAMTALNAFAEAIRTAGDQLSQRDQKTAALLASQTAEGLDKLSRGLASTRPEDLLHSVRDIGRSNPAAFMVGSVLCGLALGRLARSSSQHAAPAPAPTSEAFTSQTDAVDETLSESYVGAGLDGSGDGSLVSGEQPQVREPWAEVNAVGGSSAAPFDDGQADAENDRG